MRQQTGVGLVEIMVTVLVVSISILGTIRLQAGSLQDNHQAWLRTCADMMASDMFERLLANSDAAMAGSYNLGAGEQVPSGSAIASVDLSQWLEQVALQLPAGTGAVSCSSDGLCSVTVSWQDTGLEDDINNDGVVDETDQTTSIQLVSAL